MPFSDLIEGSRLLRRQGVKLSFLSERAYETHLMRSYKYAHHEIMSKMPLSFFFQLGGFSFEFPQVV